MYNNVLPATLSTGIFGISGLVSILFCCVYIAFLLIGLALFALWVWMLVDVIQRQESEFGDSFGKGSDAKIIWLILMIITGGIASVIYYFLVYKKYPRK